MPNALPQLYSQFGTPVVPTQTHYGLIKTLTCKTNVTIYMNAMEQRFVEASPLVTFQVPLHSLLDEDRNKWIGVNGFFENIQGRAAQDITLTLGDVTYSDLTCMLDDLVLSNSKPLQYDTQVTFRQVKNYPWTVPNIPTTDYPVLQFGTGAPTAYTSEMPFVQTSCFLTTINENEYGPRFGRPWYGAGAFTGPTGAVFPTSFLREWKLSYPLLDDTDADTLEQFFLACQGRYQMFNYADPIDGDTFAGVRFDSDSLVRRYIAPGQNSMEVTLRETQ